MHTHIHTSIQTHKYTHAYIHTHKHTNTHTPTKTYPRIEENRGQGKQSEREVSELDFPCLYYSVKKHLLRRYKAGNRER